MTAVSLPAVNGNVAVDTVANESHQLVKVEFGVAGNATVVSPSNPLPVNQLTVGNTSVNAFPAGFQRTTDEPRQTFYDPFDSNFLDTLVRWQQPVTGGGGDAVAVASGSLTVGSGTTANGYAYLNSRPSFVPTIPAWLGVSFAISIENAVGNNAVRFWGFGTVVGTPTSTNPLGPGGNGIGFELDTSGVLQAVVYSNGTRTAVASLASFQPSDASLHRYILYARTDRIYWYVDGLGSTQLAATSSFQSPQVQTQPVLMLSVAHSSGPAASRVITCAGLAVWDTGKNTTRLGDGLYSWLTQSVKDSYTAAAAADKAAVVALSPNTPLPPGQNLIGAITGPTIESLLYQMLVEMRTQTWILHSCLGARDDPDELRQSEGASIQPN